MESACAMRFMLINHFVYLPVIIIILSFTIFCICIRYFAVTRFTKCLIGFWLGCPKICELGSVTNRPFTRRYISYSDFGFDLAYYILIIYHISTTGNKNKGKVFFFMHSIVLYNTIILNMI